MEAAGIRRLTGRARAPEDHFRPIDNEPVFAGWFQAGRLPLHTLDIFGPAAPPANQVVIDGLARRRPG